MQALQPEMVKLKEKYSSKDQATQQKTAARNDAVIPKKMV